MQHTSRTLMESELNLLISAKNIVNYVFSARVPAPGTTFGAHKIIVHSSGRSRRGLVKAFQMVLVSTVFLHKKIS